VALLLRQPPTGGPEVEGTSDSFLTAYRHLLALAPDACAGIGSDANGFAGFPRPRAHGATVDYPFPAPVGGAPMSRAVLGDRSFDVGRDGVAHIGMLPDFIADLGAAGLTDAEQEPLLRSAIRYVDAWEQALARR
jgi:hypothetical protein